MQVADMAEHEDGSATLTFDLSKEETSMLVEYALQQLLRKAALEYEVRSGEFSEPLPETP